jgi:hypothetical protein
MLVLGDTFLGGAEVHGEHHLWVVINDPQAHDGHALIVNLTSLRPNADTTCVVKAGEHPFIQHDSYVRFRSARGPKAADIAKAIEAGKLMSQNAASPALLTKLRAGARASTLLAMELKDLL